MYLPRRKINVVNKIQHYAVSRHLPLRAGGVCRDAAVFFEALCPRVTGWQAGGSGWRGIAFNRNGRRVCHPINS
jgi:hypothetical protein